MGFMPADVERKDLYNYHQVFASVTATVFNLAQIADSEHASERKQLQSLLKYVIRYCIIVNKDNAENQADYDKLTKKTLFDGINNDSEKLFDMWVEKMAITRLTPNYEISNYPKEQIDAVNNEVEKHKKEAEKVV